MLLGSSSDLVPGLVRLGLGLLVLAAIAGVALWLARRRGSTTVAMDVALTLSAWWVALSLIGMVMTVVNTITGTVGFESGALIDVSWPSSIPCDAVGDESAPVLRCDSGTLESVWVMGSSLGIRTLVAVGQIASTALSIVPAALLGTICFLTLKGHPFTRTVTRALLIGAAGVLVLGLVAGILPEISGVLALREVLAPGNEWYPEAFEFRVPLLPIGGAIALAALAAVFREGARLHEERFRLQQENEQLQRETEGLV